MNNLARLAFGTIFLFQSSAFAAVIIQDDFNDGNLATNTTGTGSGFDNIGQLGGTETGGNAYFSNTVPGSSATMVMTSKDSFDAFQSGVTTTSTFSLSTAHVTNTSRRTYVGLRNSTANNNHFIPFTNSLYQGLYVSIYQSAGDILGANAHQGNLVSVSNTGAQSILASWDWDSFSTNSGALDIIMETDDSSYNVSFSQSITLQSGSLSGNVSSLGVLPATMEVGIHNQFVGNTLSVNSITVETFTQATVPNPTVPALMLLGLAGLRLRKARKTA